MSNMTYENLFLQIGWFNCYNLYYKTTAIFT